MTTVERISIEQLHKWRADPGWTAITLEILPHDPITVSMPDRDLDEVLRDLERRMKITEADRTDMAYYAEIRRTMIGQLVPAVAVARFDRGTISNCAVLALWCVLNHPRDLGTMRYKMDALRAQGKAPHFTLCRGAGAKATYGTVLGDRYADIRRDVQQRVGAETTILTTRDLR